MKRRQFLTFAAVVLLAGPSLSADPAEAQDRGRGRGRGREGGRGEGRGRGGDDRRWDRGGPGEGRGYRRFDDAPRDYGPPQRVRPGGYLPPEQRGAPVDDYPRYRLRQPPRGYAWRRMGDGFVLVDPNGRVFDIVPD